MKPTTPLFAGLLFATAASVQAASVLVPLWADEFNDYSGTPDETLWTPARGGGGWGNGEEQYYTDRTHNLNVANGVLTITADDDNFNFQGYTSGRLHSNKALKYGRVEVRAKLPSGAGTWPAIWMLPVPDGNPYGSWPASGELDIMEHVGKDPTNVYSSVHTNVRNGMTGTPVQGKATGDTWESEFHVYAMEWTEQQILFYVDDERILRYYHDSAMTWQGWPFDQPFYLIMNVALGGSWGGTIDDSIFPQTMEVDYVRVYEFQETNYPGVDESGWLKTDGLGWVNVALDPWIWSDSLQSWVYAPEPVTTPEGFWVYTVRPNEK